MSSGTISAAQLYLTGQVLLCGISTARKVVAFTGDALTATFITGESQIFEDGRAFVRNIRPLVQGPASATATTTASGTTTAIAVTAQIGSRNNLTSSISYGSTSTMNTEGWCPVRSNARYHRLRMDVVGNFQKVIGFDIDAEPEGER